MQAIETYTILLGEGAELILFRKETTISLTQGLQYTLTLLTSHFSKKKTVYDFNDQVKENFLRQLTKVPKIISRLILDKTI